MSSKSAAKKESKPVGEKLGSKEYEQQLKKLHVELVKLQEWVSPRA